MILQAARDFSLDLDRSVMVGDQTSDIDAARAAGIGTIVHYCNAAAAAITDGHGPGRWLTVTDLRAVIPLLEPGRHR
jgi:histidinol phosphatase-like enzyme